MTDKEWKPTHKMSYQSQFAGEEVMVVGERESSLCKFKDGDRIWYSDNWLIPITSEPPSVPEETKSPTAPHGGPSDYYDFDKGFCTANDIMEFLASDRWLGDALHMKDIFKACFRWGKKQGTSKEYDAKKIIYSAARLLRQYSGQEEMRAYLQSLLDDKQFGGKS